MLGASPDAIVKCDCCGIGIVEVKCPYNAVKEPLMDLILNGDIYLKLVDGDICLDRKHEYFYQVQLQLLMTERNFCDFVVWSDGDWFCERILQDSDFIQESIPKVLKFYEEAVLLEILGKWFSRPRQAIDARESESVCHCGSSESMDTVIKCQSGYCKIQTFHLSCLKLKNVPKRKWLCQDCRSLKKRKEV